MYCPNCGNDMKDAKFCPQCGYSDGVGLPVYTEPSTKPAKSSKGGIAAIVALIVLGVVGLIAVVVLVFVFAFKFINKLEISDFISLKDVEISSIYKATGKEADICGTKSNMSGDEAEFKITFCNDLDQKDIERYVDYLIKNEGFSLYEGSYDYSLKKILGDRTVYVFIVDSNTIIYSLHAGDYDLDNQRIGV